MEKQAASAAETVFAAADTAADTAAEDAAAPVDVVAWVETVSATVDDPSRNRLLVLVLGVCATGYCLETRRQTGGKTTRPSASQARRGQEVAARNYWRLQRRVEDAAAGASKEQSGRSGESVAVDGQYQRQHHSQQRYSLQLRSCQNVAFPLIRTEWSGLRQALGNEAPLKVHQQNGPGQ